MFKNCLTFVLLMGISAICLGYAPEGLWKTIDDKTGKARALVLISSEENDLSGKIVKVFKQKGDKGICVNCQGEEKNKPVVGLTILTHMHKEKTDNYAGGEILDPKSGKRYRCKIKQVDANTLEVRGFLGMPLLGRTQTWQRVNSKRAA